MEFGDPLVQKFANSFSDHAFFQAKFYTEIQNVMQLNLAEGIHGSYSFPGSLRSFTVQAKFLHYTVKKSEA